MDDIKDYTNYLTTLTRTVKTNRDSFNEDDPKIIFFQLDEDGKAGCVLQVDCDVKRTCGSGRVCALSPSYPYAIVYAKVSLYTRHSHFKQSSSQLLVCTTGVQN